MKYKIIISIVTFSLVSFLAGLSVHASEMTKQLPSDETYPQSSSTTSSVSSDSLVSSSGITNEITLAIETGKGITAQNTRDVTANFLSNQLAPAVLSGINFSPWYWWAMTVFIVATVCVGYYSYRMLLLPW